MTSERNTLGKQAAKHLRDVHFGGNWSVSSLKQHLTDVTWEESRKKIGSLNSLLTLTCHMSYYVNVIKKVVEGGPLEGKDADSYILPPINSQADWDQMLERAWEEAEALAISIEQLPDERFYEPFSDEKYGTFYRNIHGVIEHFHYHLGQVVVIKKLLRENVHL